jgi:hypothetical protein
MTVSAEPPRARVIVASAKAAGFYETGKYAGSVETVAAIEGALEKAGVQFTNGKRPGVRLATHDSD